MKQKFISRLAELVSPERYKRFVDVVEERTRYMTILLEDIYQPQNASAVLRSCECMGIQDVHIVENKNAYQINPDVVMGAYKWLSVNRYNQKEDNTASAFQQLKQGGYRIVATSPHKKSVVPETFDLNKGKFVICLGTELTGLSETIMENADEFLYIPMVGFTESLNLSVSAAIMMHALTGRLRKEKINWQLNTDEKQSLLIQWLLNHNSKLNKREIIDQFCTEQSIAPEMIIPENYNV
jgi:tRNA (guanosine-2'-O-)-methyltransferase